MNPSTGRTPGHMWSQARPLRQGNRRRRFSAGAGLVGALTVMGTLVATPGRCRFRVGQRKFREPGRDSDLLPALLCGSLHRSMDSDQRHRGLVRCGALADSGRSPVSGAERRQPGRRCPKHFHVSAHQVQSELCASRRSNRRADRQDGAGSRQWTGGAELLLRHHRKNSAQHGICEEGVHLPLDRNVCDAAVRQHDLRGIWAGHR